MRRTSLWLLVVLLLPGAALAQKVDVQWDKDHDFTGVKTFGFAEGQPAKRKLTHQRIVSGLEYHLALAGLEQAEDDATPDVYVIYHGSTEEEVEVDERIWGYASSDWYTRPGGSGTRVKTERKYLKGTLVVDIYDAETKQLLWQATASDSISADYKKNEKKIDKALDKMFEKFPARK